MHTAYLVSLLNFPPLPSPIPSSSTLPAGATQDGISVKLLKADFTGIILLVESSRNPSLIGLRGIVIEETGSTFRIVSTDSKVRVVPKEGTQFVISFPAYSPPSSSTAAADDGAPIDWETHLRVCPRIEMLLLGTNFGYRSGDRAGRKFKLAQGQVGSGWGESWVKGEWDAVFPPVPTKRRRKGGKERSSDPTSAGGMEKGMGAEGMRKKGKSRRKDPFAGGSREAVF
jgi:ribonuclease P protein subunit POP4